MSPRNRLESVEWRCNCNLEDRLMLADFDLRSFRLTLCAKRSRCRPSRKAIQGNRALRPGKLWRQEIY